MKGLWGGCLLWLCFSSVNAWTLDDVRLLQKEYQQYQAWVLSRDYFFGTTLTANRIKALAWQLVYVGMLPATYPEKERLLNFYRENLSGTEITQANELAEILRGSYELDDSLSEEELARIHALHEENLSLAILSDYKTVPVQDIHYRKTGVIGRVLPWLGLSHSDIMLRLVSPEKKKSNDPWYRAVVPLTVTDEGKFYATGLSPGRYELAITTAGTRTFKQFTLQKGEVRGLSLIDLRSQVKN